MEHRWGVRHLLDVSVRLDGRPQVLTFVRLKDASSSGAYIETRAAPPMLSRIWVELGVFPPAWSGRRPTLCQLHTRR
jgi:hypothetical protein